jgi:hypothetical protein
LGEKVPGLFSGVSKGTGFIFCENLKRYRVYFFEKVREKVPGLFFEEENKPGTFSLFCLGRRK